MADDLEVIEDSRRRVVQYNGREIEVRPITISQLPGFTRAIKPALPLLSAQFLGEDRPEEYLDLLEAHLPALIEAVSLAVGVKAKDIAAGGLDDFEALLEAVVEVNSDVFRERRSPLMAKAASLMHGPTSSSASSKRATGAKKSTATR